VALAQLPSWGFHIFCYGGKNTHLRIPHWPFIQYYCGTSAGALNATMLLLMLINFSKAASTLALLWRHLHPDQKLYSVGRWPVASSIVTKTLLSLFPPSHKQDTSIALMDNTPLKELLNKLPFGFF